MASPAGFTLVEVSIVLVIIALLTAGVISAQKVIENARFKSLVEQIEAYRAATMIFQQEYGYLPGDFPDATTTFDLPTGVTTYDGDGVGTISSHYYSTIGAPAIHEGANALQHLILAGLIEGDPGATDQAQVTPVGGKFARIQHSEVIENSQKTWRLVLNIRDLPIKYAKRLDYEYDDGSAKTGAVRSEYWNDWPAGDEGKANIVVDL